MADLSFNCTAYINSISPIIKDATPREILVLAGKVLRLFHPDTPLTGETVEMYLHLLACHAAGPAAVNQTRYEKRTHERVLK